MAEREKDRVTGKTLNSLLERVSKVRLINMVNLFSLGDLLLSRSQQVGW